MLNYLKDAILNWLAEAHRGLPAKAWECGFQAPTGFWHDTTSRALVDPLHDRLYARNNAGATSRISVIVFGVLLFALCFEVLAHIVKQAYPELSLLSGTLTLVAVITLLLPAVYLIVRYDGTPVLKSTIVSSFVLLLLSQLIQVTASIDYFDGWPVISESSPLHDMSRWVCLVLGLVLMMASLYFALLETVMTRSRLMEEHAQLRQEAAIRSRAEQALVEREDLYRQAITQAGAIPYRVNWTRKEYTFYDDTVSRLTGFTRDELTFEKLQSLPIERRFIGVLSGLSQQEVDSGFANGTLNRWQCEYRFKTKSGEERWILDSSIEIPGPDGSIAETVGLFQDITDRKREEEAIKRNERYFRALTEKAQDLITVLNADGTIRYESPSIESVLGYGQDELTGRNVFDFIHPDDRSRALDTFVHAVAEPNASATVNFRCLHQDGTYRMLESIGINRLSDPDVMGVVINSRDVTDRLALEQQLLQSQKMEGIGRLAGGIAHDFNNLLTCIMGYSEYITAKSLPGDWYVPHVTEITQASRRASELTRQLLAFARKQISEPRNTNLNALLTNIDKMLCRLIGEDIELVTIPSTEPSVALIDPVQFEQVVLNLIVNARDAMPEGGKITVELDHVELDDEYSKSHPEVLPGPYILFAVSDTGAGMTEEVKSHIFEPFFTTKGPGKGTGLGLAMCYGIVKQSGGHIWVYSEPGRGTTFKIYLPRVADAVPAAERTTGRNIAKGGTETILVVEDEPGVRSIAERTLSDRGYTVIVAPDGAAALEIALREGTRIDLLLTDVVLPHLNGPELVARLNGDLPGLKVLYMSGYTEDAIVHRGVLQNSIDFLPKPFTSETLAHKVRDVLDQSVVS
ncbi:MAG: hypothetical protein AMXMBFR84_11370 [Candidatus Hydrogenedentota bacterium]